MANFANYAENAILNWMRGTTFPASGTFTLALFKSPVTTSELEAGTLTNEVSTSGSGYSRKTITFSAISGNSIKNNIQIEWTATSNWGTVTHYAIFLGTNCIVWGALTASRTVNNGDVLRFPADSITISVD